MDGIKNNAKRVGRDILESEKDFFLTMDKRGILFIALILILIGIGILTSRPPDRPQPLPQFIPPLDIGITMNGEVAPLQSGIVGYQAIDPIGKKILDFKVSHYDPVLGGVNCSAFYDGECHSKMASGMKWQDYYRTGSEKGVVMACPPTYKMWTVIVLISPPTVAGRYICLDTGGKIVDNWVDILHSNEGYDMPYGAIAKGYVESSP